MLLLRQLPFGLAMALAIVISTLLLFALTAWRYWRASHCWSRGWH
jgi:hypothetical protein